MATLDELPRRSLFTYRRSTRVQDEETVPDSEDSISTGQTRLPEDEDTNLVEKQNPIPADRPRPPRAAYRARKRTPSPPPLSYSSMAPTEEVIPDSEDNSATLGTSDNDHADDNSKDSPENALKTSYTGLSDWKQKLRDIDDEYDTDEDTQSPHKISSAVSHPKEAFLEDHFGNPPTTQASSQHASHQSRANGSLSSPSRNLSSSTNTTPQFVFGTPHTPSPTPPTSDGKPSPKPKTRVKTKAKVKGKGKARALPATEEATTTVDDDSLPSSPDGVRRQTRRREKPNKSKAPTKKELLEARRETARMRSDMRASISTDATRPLDIKTLLKRFDVNQPPPSARPLQPQSSVSEIEAWTSSPPSASASASAPDREPSETHQGTETSRRQQQKSRHRSLSPFQSNGLLAPPSKYRVSTAAVALDDNDNPFRISASAPAAPPTKEMEEADLGLADSGSDDEMPGIADILAEKQTRESLREQKERLQKLKLAVLAQQQQKKNASTNAAADMKVDEDEGGDDDDDGLDVVQEDTMHSVARQEAAARAKAGRSRPSTGRAMQLRMARVASSPPQQRAATQRHLLTSTSPEKRMAAAAQSTFLALANSSSGNNGSSAVRSGTTIGMSKDELERMVLRRAEAQSERLRREKEEEWVRRGGRVVGVMQVVGDEKVKELIGEALERGDKGAHASARDDGDDDDDDDGDYVPPGERGSVSPQPRPIETEEMGDDGEVQTHAMEVLAPPAVDDDDDDNHDAAEEATSEEVESHVLTDEVRLRQGPHAARARLRRAIIGSDDEDEGQQQLQQSLEEAEPPPLSLPDLPSPAFTSTASPWLPTSTEPDHDHDHENDLDVSGNDTDKENRAVVRRDDARPAPAHGARVLFDDLLSVSASGTTTKMTTAASAVQPLPLLQPSVFAPDDDPFAFTPSLAKAGDEALRRLENPTPTPPPMCVFDVAAIGTAKRGLSQLFEDEEEENGDSSAQQRGGGDNATATQGDGLMGFKPALGGLSEAFEPTQEASGSGAGSGVDGLAALRRGANAELSLTLEAQAAALQPALEVDDSLRARAAAIFEKEQEYVIQAARPASSCRPRRELYITENGFLTQTRPEGSSPLLYRPSPSQRPYDALFLRTQSQSVVGDGAMGATQMAASSPLVMRQPLSTLAETSPVLSSSPMGREPLRRLRRAHTSPDDPASEPLAAQRYPYPRRQSLSPSPSPAKAKGRATAGTAMPRTAFTELMMGAHHDKVKTKMKKKLSEFVEDQAVESDEDDMLGFGGVRRKQDDDDDDDDDLEHDEDDVVKNLVDDAHMDETALAKAKILEKHIEHQDADDARLEKEVQDVVAGKKRTGRRRGAGGLLGSDGSDESEDDEEARALRQRLAKKRRVEGDTLDELARNPATASFHATYQMALVDDAEEFAHLHRDEDVELLEAELDQGGQDEGGEEGDDGQDREEGGSEDRRGEGEGEDEDEDVEMAEPSKMGKEEISAAEVRKALQQVARGEREYHALDPQDVSWMDQELDPDETDAADTLHKRVRIASSTAPKASHRPAQHLLSTDADVDVLSLHRIHPTEEQQQLEHDSAYAQRMKRWASEEGATNRSGSGRGTGGVGTAGAGAAVTGHHHRPRGANSSSNSTKSKQTATKTTTTAAAGPSGSSSTTTAPRKTASVLSAAMADRRGRFGA